MSATERVSGGRWATDPLLHLTTVPEGALDVGLDGKRVTSPIQGFGKLWQKRYLLQLDGVDADPAAVVRIWKTEFASFWPEGNHFYGPVGGMEPGQTALLNLHMPGGVRMATGILVLFADDESFTFMTPEGHGFAGWITFSAARTDGTTTALVDVLIRASDPLYELGMALGGHRMEDRAWQHTLIELGRRLGADPDIAVVTTRTCVDRRRQWHHARNLRHNALIRSALAPVRPRRRLPAV